MSTIQRGKYTLVSKPLCQGCKEERDVHLPEHHYIFVGQEFLYSFRELKEENDFTHDELYAIMGLPLHYSVVLGDCEIERVD